MAGRRWSRAKMRADVSLVPGEWVRLPGVDGVELCQQDDRPMVVSWFPYGSLPNGVVMSVRADLPADEPGLLVPGYWDLSLARRRCLIRHSGMVHLPAPREEPR